jgi:Fe-S-cluster containining protein
MTLTEADVARLARLGERDFFLETPDGELRLRNVSGRCVFLAGGRCRVYPHRPEGCRLYPLILDLDSRRTVCDDFCPHHEDFAFGPLDRLRLRASVAAEARESRARCAERRRRD